MKVITLLNEKGGVGKTTLAIHIAAGLSLRGYTVVLVDADPQGNATTALGLAKEPAVHDLIVRNASWRDSLRSVHPDVYSPPDYSSPGKLFAVPSNVETRNIANTISDGLQVKKRLAQLEGSTHFVIIDTSPTPSMLHGSIVIASDYVLLPTECEMYSFNGLADSILHNENAQEFAKMHGLKPVEIMGIVPMMFRPKTVTHGSALKALRRLYPGQVWQPIINRIVWAEAALNKQLLFGFAPRHAASNEIMQLVDKVAAVAYEQTT